MKNTKAEIEKAGKRKHSIHRAFSLSRLPAFRFAGL
jgi:hypothetical protein